MSESVRLRLIKEAINILLPVAQVGGDVVRTRMAASSRLPLSAAAASCILDVAVGLVCLAVFVCLGLAAASAFIADTRVRAFAVQLCLAIAVLVAALLVAERLGGIGLMDRAVARSTGALGPPSRTLITQLVGPWRACRAASGKHALLDSACRRPEIFGTRFSRLPCKRRRCDHGRARVSPRSTFLEGLTNGG